jgi:hypothetical protein
MKRPLPATTFTAIADLPAQSLLCPICTKPLVFLLSAFGGVSPRERWDYLKCRTCGGFEYRHRTHRFKRTDEISAA